jgi:hypothetical protein
MTYLPTLKELPTGELVVKDLKIIEDTTSPTETPELATMNLSP